METNDVGQVALKYHQPVQKYVQMGDGAEYVFIVRANISFAWVQPNHVDFIMNIRRNDCSACGNKPVFRYANSDDVRRWTVGGGR